MKVTRSVQFILVLMAWTALTATCSLTFGNETDLVSLRKFKNAVILDPQKTLASWNETTHFCNWAGILCSKKNPRRVTSINLENRDLVGQISPALGNLTYLKYLSLSTNRFTGQIPPSLAHLHRLQSLYLSNNTIQGNIPDFASCSNLKVLWLNSNNLVGRFPTVPSRLQELQLSDNNLTGTIPASLANITSLTHLSCAHNNIWGNIPQEFSMLPKLIGLYVNANLLVGTFPQAVMNLSTLSTLYLPLNRFSGELPSDLGSSLPNLESLSLGANFFHGHIPSSLINASNIFELDMSRNNFSGVVPSSIGKLTKLVGLNLEMNKLQARTMQEWEFMNSLANCTELLGLSLAYNQLDGQLPSSLANLTFQLQRLYLGGNELSGEIPSGRVNLPNLFVLGLERNQFTGMLPEWLGTLKNLQLLDLGGNVLTGPIPSFLSNLTRMVVLYLEYNQFVQVPSSLGSLTMLNKLVISNNLLRGMIPIGIFGIPTLVDIDLSSNNLYGKLPKEVGNAKQLIKLVLSSNKLSGDIPDTLYNCESLEYVMLDQNTFSGSIPASLGNTSSLQVLNLSCNNLTGSIPVSLGNLKHIEELDFSFNHLKGEVPVKGPFGNVTSIRIEGNPGLCGGAMELHLPSCPFVPSASAKHKLPIVLVVIPVAIAVLLALVISLLLLFRRRKQMTKSISLPSFGRGFPKISYRDLVRATEGFAASTLIGQGRYGSVYRGKLFQDGNVVAIKVFSLETRGAQKTFIAECNALRSVRHRNLVPILTACSTIDFNGNDFKALVYEFMSRGDLYNLLYSTRAAEDSSVSNNISLAQRLSIVVDVSDALAYLHHSHQGTIVHCDLKPSNILLDDDMVAHVGDFGLARFRFGSATSPLTDSNSTSSVAIKGTIGYIAPECAGGGQASTASDVYSFGVILLEIFIRRRPTDDMFKDGTSIARFTEANFPDNVLRIVDPQLLRELDFCTEAPMAIKDRSEARTILQSVLSIGLCCTKAVPNVRISMQEVAAKLQGIRDAYLRGNRS